MMSAVSPLPPRIDRVDIPVPLVLREDGWLVKIFLHPEVAMRNPFISMIDVSSLEGVAVLCVSQ